MSYQDVVAAMHYYVDMGLPIIPICPHDHEGVSAGHEKICRCNGKIPLISGWVQRRETTEEHLQEWLSSFKKMNVGMPLGEASGYCGIDIDGEAGERLFQEMSKGEIPETWEFITGAGRRLLYRIPVGIKTKKFKKTGSGAHEECAILCTGQQSVLPPSIHHTGTIYEWAPGRGPSDIDCADAPKWLIDMIRIDPTTQRRTPPTVIPDRIMSFEEEFKVADFNAEIPEDIASGKIKEVNSRKASKVDIQNESEIAAMLYQTIPEGSRDNTMTQIIGHFLSKPEYRKMPTELFLDLMANYNLKYCDPPLDFESIQAKVTYFTEIEAQKSAAYKNHIANEKKFLPSQVAQTVLNVLKDQKGLLIDYDTKTQSFYVCHANRGPWLMKSANYLQEITSMIREIISSPNYGDTSWDKKHHIEEVVAALKDILISSDGFTQKTFDLSDNLDMHKKYITVDGQLLDWRTGELHPWSYDHKSTTSFEVGYDPKATCPHWMHYMSQWIPDEGSRRIVQEFLGYCLIPDTSIEHFLILSGSGSNGKSMLLNYIRELFSGACSSLSTTKMTERFGKAGLYGKLINICTEDEGDNGYIRHTDEIKALVSGEEVSAEYKGKDMFQFKNTARLIFATNNIPKSKDRTTGWYRRQIIISFPNQFEKNMNKAREMNYYMEKERPGIFNWLLEGLRNVMNRGELQITSTVQENQNEFKAINDPLEGFLRECTRKTAPSDTNNKRAGISTICLYKLYEFWCEDNYGDKARQLKMVQRTFTERIQKEKAIEKNKGYCFLKQNNKQQCFFGITIDIKDEGMKERLIEAFKGYSMLEPESLIAEFIIRQDKEKEAAN